MRYLSVLLMLCALSVAFLVSGCGKKAEKADETPAETKVTFASGNCAVCGKQSTKLTDFKVFEGPMVKIDSADCAAKIMADPVKYGGKPSPKPPAPK
jgi:hypothetical protein